MYNMLFYSIMTFLGFSAASATAASFNETDTHHWTVFQNFVHKFDKSYTNLVEFEKRFDIFRDNLHYIREQNGMNNKYLVLHERLNNTHEILTKRFVMGDGGKKII